MVYSLKVTDQIKKKTNEIKKNESTSQNTLSFPRRLVFF